MKHIIKTMENKYLVTSLELVEELFTRVGVCYGK